MYRSRFTETDLYTNQARFAVILVSRHYIQRRWTKLERQAVQARAFKQDSPYLLPLRLDDTELQGLPPTVAYVQWKGDPGHIADLLAEKLGKSPDPAAERRWPEKRKPLSLDFLSKPERKRLRDFRARFMDKDRAILLLGPEASLRSGMPEDHAPRFFSSRTGSSSGKTRCR